jgi:hypothetical protein
VKVKKVPRVPHGHPEDKETEILFYPMIPCFRKDMVLEGFVLLGSNEMRRAVRH